MNWLVYIVNESTTTLSNIVSDKQKWFPSFEHYPFFKKVETLHLFTPLVQQLAAFQHTPHLVFSC